MEELLIEFQRLLADSFERFKEMSDDEAALPIAPGKWSRKQILGHLIDSASNNHQRFVRGQLADDCALPGYEQDQWVEAQRYAETDWQDLLMLWISYNVHLLRVISGIPEEKLTNRCRIGSDDPATLRFLIEDYVRHLRHHLEQMLGPIKEEQIYGSP